MLTLPVTLRSPGHTNGSGRESHSALSGTSDPSESWRESNVKTPQACCEHGPQSRQRAKQSKTQTMTLKRKQNQLVCSRTSRVLNTRYKEECPSQNISQHLLKSDECQTPSWTSKAQEHLQDLCTGMVMAAVGLGEEKVTG